MANASLQETSTFRAPPDRPHFAEGIIRVRRIPAEWSDAEYAYWWLPQTNGRGKILCPARMSEQEKERYQTDEFSNLITTNGRNSVLTYIGSSTGSTTQWAQYIAVGTGAITSVQASDNALANEVFRKTQTTYSVSGTSVDINFSFGSSEGQYSYTNAGIFGAGASATLGSGTLQTHALFSYTKGAYGISVDYLINLL